ncbi:MAG: tetratricopeptide repeat protein, partial [Planctomycetaceae bacterium]|nr:tetratricopeptide repeat protein [Planctomycetaceae bacterium]
MANRRDDFSEAVIRVVLLRVGARCSNPACRTPTHGPLISDPNKALNLGEASHITAAAPGGPRYDPAMTAEERKSALNAIWLCRQCARQIDTDEPIYPVELLHEWKRTAEEYAARFTADQLRAAGSLPAAWNVPFRRNPNFTGRDQLLDELHQALASGRPAAVVQAIHGQGGAGKTALAVEYAYRHVDEYNTVCWVDSESAATLGQSYVALAKVLKIDTRDLTDEAELIDAVRGWFENNVRWLLVLDNAVASGDLERYLPRSSTGHVLITSRNPGWDETAESVRVPVWPRVESVAYLLNRTKETDAAAADELAYEFGDLPLALAQAAGYITMTSSSTKTYLELFRARRRDLWQIESPPKDYQQTVATTWDLALERLTPASVELLNLLAYLGPESVPRSLMTDNPGQLPTELAPVASDPLRFNAIIGELSSLSLIESTESTLSCHRLIQAVVRDRLRDDEQQPGIERALALVNAAFPVDREDPRPSDRLADLVPHALTVVTHAQVASVGIDAASRLADALGNYFQHRGSYSAARDLLKRAIEIKEKAYAPDHPTLAVSYSNLGMVERALGNLDAARDLLKRAIEIEEKAYAPDHPTLAVSYSNLALVEQALGNLDAAR